MKRARLNLRVSDETKELLQQAAAASRVSMSEVADGVLRNQLHPARDEHLEIYEQLEEQNRVLIEMIATLAGAMFARFPDHPGEDAVNQASRIYEKYLWAVARQTREQPAIHEILAHMRKP